MTDTLKAKVVIVNEHRAAHPALKAAIERKFEEPEDRIAAWATVGIMREVFPAIVEIIQGPLLWREERED